MVVSLTGDPRGFVDDTFAHHRVVLTGPNFMAALAIVADTDLIATLPRVTMHAARFDVVSPEAPLPLVHYRILAISSKVTLLDEGVAWLFEMLERAVVPGSRSS